MGLGRSESKSELVQRELSVCPGEMSLPCLVLAQRGSNLPPGWGTRWWLREEDRAGSGLMGRRRRRRPRQECDNPCVHFARSSKTWMPLSPLARYVRMGWSNRRIAAELGIAEGTVKRHVSNILEKSGLESRTQLALALGA